MPKTSTAGFERPTFNHQIPMPTRWGDADRLGHINNVLYVRYYESARLDYFEGKFDLEFNPNSAQGLIIAEFNISYLRQLVHPEQLTVSSRISRLGNSSFDFESAIFKQDEDEPVSISTAVCLWFNFEQNKSMPIPGCARQQIKQFEGL